MRPDLTTITRDLYESMTPFTVGFDEIFRRLEQVKVPSVLNGFYPPFNVKKVDDNHYAIEMAVAGFGKNDIDITMENGTLTITGKVQSETKDSDDNYLFKGIAARQFSRSFSLADSLEIKNAEIVNGMLRVYLENLIPLSKQAKKIPIKNGGDQNEGVEDTRQLLNEESSKAK